jgi:hypothetical protein
LREDKAAGEITTEIATSAKEAEKHVASRKPSAALKYAAIGTRSVTRVAAKRSRDRSFVGAQLNGWAVRGAPSTSGPAIVMGRDDFQPRQAAMALMPATPSR